MVYVCINNHNKHITTMELQSSEQAYSTLEPYFEDINNTYNEALKEMNKMLSATNTLLNARAKSNLLHALAMSAAKKYFSDYKDIKLKEEYSTMEVVFKGEQAIVARFKKVNKQNLSSNITTRRSNAINLQYSLFPYSVTYVDIGYRLDESETEFEAIVLVCRRGQTVLWSFDVTQSDSLGIILPSTQTGQLSIKEEKQIKIKKARNGS
ncbi:MAG: hypothetical protein COA58_15000 [Bacteroidetes bacterium]|nr:MAG: hypothetical protein COA58_15000 [Bacteroidota bacterium]